MKTVNYPAEWGQRARLYALAAVVLFWLVAAVIYLPLLNLTLMAVLIVYALYYPTAAVARLTGWSYALVATLIFVLFMVLGFALLFAAGIPLLNWLQVFAGTVRELVHQATLFLTNYSPEQGWIVDDADTKIINLNFILEPLSEIAKRGQSPDEIVNFTLELATSLFGVATSFASTALSTLGVLTIAYYMLLELPLAARFLRGLPTPQRREISILLVRCLGFWKLYLRGIVVISLIGGVATYIQLLAMGIGDALFLSILSTLIYLIPIFGGFIAPVFIAIGAAFAGSSWIHLDPVLLGLLTYLVFVVVQGGIVSGVVTPKVFGNIGSIPVTVIILGMVVFTMIGGLMGALLAVPAIGIIREIQSFLTHKIRGGDPYPGEVEPDYLKE